jgi:hypothetical protein
VEGELRVAGGASRVIIRNNIVEKTLFTGNTFEVSGHTTARADGHSEDQVFDDTDIFILNNTATRKELTNGSGDSDEAFFKLLNYASGIVMANNLYWAQPSYTIFSNRYVLDLGSNDLSSFAAIKDNIWIDPSNTNVRMRIQNNGVTKQNWTNANYPVMIGDVFANVTLTDPLNTDPEGRDFTPTTNTATASALPGIFGDFKGNLRPTIVTSGASSSPGAWTAGAVQAADAYTFRDFGNPVYPGSFGVNTAGSDYTLKAGGTDVLGGTDDQYLFGYRQITGNFDYMVRVHDLGDSGSSTYAQAGLMARLGLAVDSPNFFVSASHGDGFRYTWRDADGSSGIDFGPHFGATGYPNTYVRLRRDGDTLYGYDSQDGAHWELTGYKTLSLGGAPVYFGVAACAHNSDGAPVVSARFDSLAAVTGTVGLLFYGDKGGTSALDTWTIAADTTNNAYILTLQRYVRSTRGGPRW